MAGPSTVGPGSLAAQVVVGPLGALDPTAVFDAPPEVRAGIAFATVLALGGLLVLRFGPFVERSIDATRSRPLASTVYGVAAHLVVLFVVFYLGVRLSRFELFGQSTGLLGPAFGVASVLATGALGFTVVGSTVVEVGWAPDRWAGLVVGAGLAGLIAVLSSSVAFALAAVLWVLVVSMGIGGAVRRWLTASAVSEVGERADGDA
jgi:hypothetical protein